MPLRKSLIKERDTDSAMPELHNFTSNLRRIVKPRIIDRGFSHKAVRFVKTHADIQLVVYFQRSHWSNTLHGWQQAGHDRAPFAPTNAPAKFFVTLDFQFDRVRLPEPFEEHPFERLENPDVVWPFRGMSADERERWLGGVSREEALRVLELPHPHDRVYASEDELRGQLESAAHELVTRGIPYLEAVAPILYEAKNGVAIRALKESVLHQGMI